MTECPSCRSTRTVDRSECTVPTELDSDKTPASVRDMIEPLRESRLVECRDCGLLFREPGLTAEQLTKFYRNLPETIWRYEPAQVGSWACAKKTLHQLHDTTRSLDVVDVGAFEGGFLRMLPDHWKKHAIEPSPQGRTSLRDTGVDVIGEYVDQLDQNTNYHEQFDVVTLFDVFEHLPSPIRTLDALAGLIKPGGRLLLSTGNTDHWSWRMLEGSHWYLHSVQHLCFGNAKYFRQWAKQRDLQVERIVRHPHKLASPSASMVQALETLHCWSVRKRKTWLARIIQMLPGCRDWMHRNGRTVFANSLRDHLLICFRKPIAATSAT
ncbi:MAG: class I SAM-dependent methyltransferase [Planctomycetota bacterium]